MINPGRPPNGYEDYIDIIYLLNKSLDEIWILLHYKISAIKEKCASDKKEAHDKLQKYYKKVQELKQAYIEKGESEEVAIDIA
jgi:hypothetical protein